MGKGFPLWFGAFMGVLGIALAEEVAKSSNPVKETPQVPSILPDGWVIAPQPLDSITDPVKHPLLHQMQPIWVSVDYLNYRIRNGPLPTPIVTSGQPGDAIPGAIGQPGTKILLGGPNSNGLDYGALSGIRISGGVYLDDSKRYSFEGSGFLLEQGSTGFSASTSPAMPIVTAPFTTLAGTQSSIFATVPDNLNSLPSSTINMYSYSKLSGGEANARAHLGNPGNGMSYDLLFGGRFAELEEYLAYSLDLQRANSRVLGNDQFLTRNWFYGAQIGGALKYDYKRFHAGALGKVAVGQTQQNIAIAGSRTSFQNGVQGGTATNGFVYALPSNSGMYNQSAFAVIPEVQFRLGFDITDYLQLYAGYDYFYWSSVIRPGNQIDPVLNTSQRNGGALVGAARPEVPMTQSAIWAQGLTFGFEVKY